MPASWSADLAGKNGQVATGDASVARGTPPSTAANGSPQCAGGLRLALLGAVSVQLILLALAAARNVELQNADAVAYLRIASYYADGRTDLAVSGYWGPLLSWLIAPWLLIGIPPLVAARIAMGLSAIVFLAGAVRVFRSLRLPAPAQVAGAWITALTTIYWSVQYLTPDLLVAGLICLAIGVMTEPRWVEDTRTQVLAGACWALAYSAKAIAFPLALVTGPGLAALHLAAGTADRRRTLRAFGVTLVTFGLLAAPWLVILSVKYGALTLSTSARINHALVGPPDVPRGHPLGRMFDNPAPGRITSWEDPSTWTYAYWSPFERKEYALHQLKLIVRNVKVLVALLASFDAIGLGLAGILTCLLVGRAWQERLAAEPWRWSVVPVVCMAALYLPGYLNVQVQRYLYAIFPFLLACSMGAAAWLTERFGACPWVRRSVIWLVAAFFLLPGLIRLPLAVAGLPQPASVAARELAWRLEKAGIRGAIVGSATLAGGRAGLYTAFLLNRPWYGDERSPAAEGYRRSRAELLVVTRDAPVVVRLDRSADFRNLDDLLFSSRVEAASFPLKVYRVSSP